jgi:hypothetical protein
MLLQAHDIAALDGLMPGKQIHNFLAGLEVLNAAKNAFDRSRSSMSENR